VKVKCDSRRQANQFRHKIFDGHNKPEPSSHERDLKKKRKELACVLERLQDPGLGAGMVRELRKHVAILEREIADPTLRPPSTSLATRSDTLLHRKVIDLQLGRR
jgi:hypothetical protein